MNTKRQQTKAVWDLAALLPALLFLFWSRWPSIVYPIPLNPDESQAAANTLRIRDYGFNWDALDGTTVGPLNSLVIAWPHLFGLPVSLASGRLTACVLLAVVCVIVFLSMRMTTNRWLAIASVLPLVGFYALTDSPDFLHYSSEVFPLCLLVAANHAVLRLSMADAVSRSRQWLVLGLLLGAVPFAKLQAAPVAAVIGVYGVVLTWKQYRKTPSEGLKHGAVLIGATLVPALIILAPLAARGHLPDFWNSYIAWARAYVSPPSSLVAIHDLIASDAVLWLLSTGILVVGLMALIQCLVLLARGRLNPAFSWQQAVYLVLLLAACYWVIARPGKPFAHYLMYYPPFAVMLSATLVFSLWSNQGARRIIIATWAMAASVVGSLILMASLTQGFQGAHGKYTTVLRHRLPSSTPSLLSWMPIEGESLLIWGWMPHWYLLSGWSPATRESHTYAQIKLNRMALYFRSRFMEDLQASKPAVIIDAVRGNSFNFNASNPYPPATLPAFDALLNAGYEKLVPFESSDQCAVTHVRKDLKKGFDDRLIMPASLSVMPRAVEAGAAHSLSALFDLSVTEDTCVDYWLLPKATLGTVRIDLARPEQMSRMMMLNTRSGAQLDRATGKVAVVFRHAGEAVWRREVVLAAYPKWTTLEPEAPVRADRIDIEILSFKGLGAGLNEVKLFRAP